MLVRSIQVVVLAVLVAVACGDADTESGGSPTVPVATTAPPRPSALADGSRFVLVRGLTDEAVIVDPAEFLSGADAVSAARADGVIGPDEELPNDFYIRNTLAETFEVPADGEAEFQLLSFDETGSPVPTTVPYLVVVGLYSGTVDAGNFYGFVPGDLPMQITIDGGKVVWASQQYVP